MSIYHWSFQVYHVHFRGARVFHAIIEDLLERGMKNASNVLNMYIYMCVCANPQPPQPNPIN